MNMNALIAQGAGFDLPHKLSALIRTALADMNGLDRSVYDAHWLRFHEGVTFYNERALVDLPGGVAAARGLVAPGWIGQREAFSDAPGNLIGKLNALNEVEFGTLEYALAAVACGDETEGFYAHHEKVDDIKRGMSSAVRAVIDEWAPRLAGSNYEGWDEFDQFAVVASGAADALERVGE